MPLSVGTKVGPYEILAPIGAGGMGEVYRAKDSKLKREVALKVLPEVFARDPERMARFQREAEVLASLNHPNIAAIYGVEDRALVMELVEGEQLKGPLPLDTALNYARQIAEALEYAHERGVIHRDLKPANVKVTPQSVVKLLDFGLAKAIAPDQPAEVRTENSPTLTMRAMGQTVAGVILGTAAYMSPEQARGKPADKRSDIWSFGVVLYEMATGERPFTGEAMADVLAAVINQEPRYDAVPARLRPAIERCLRKDPRKRWYSMEDVRFALDEPPEEGRSAETRMQGEVRATSRLPWLVAAGLALATGVLSWNLWRATSVVDKPLVRVDVDLGANVSIPPRGPGSPLTISPDGTKLAYISGRPAKLYIRRLDRDQAVELPGTEGAAAPTFSPNGQWLFFSAGNKANKISVDGGAVVPLLETSMRGASWGENGEIVLPMDGKGLFRISEAGGSPAPLTDLGNREVHVLPQVLPGGKAALFQNVLIGPDLTESAIEVVTFADRRRKVLATGGGTPRYAASGHLLYADKATLFAIPFDPDKLETRGTAIPVLDDVGFVPNGGSRYDLSLNGTLVYVRSTGVGVQPATVQWVDSSGTGAQLLSKPGPYVNARLSPDGKRLLLEIPEMSDDNIWIYDAHRDALTRLTSSGNNQGPIWSPDGRYVVFYLFGSGIFAMRSDGAGQRQVLVSPITGTAIPGSFSPDGKRLVYSATTNNQTGIWSVSVEEQGGRLKAGAPELLFSGAAPSVSPDGRWLAYESRESGNSQVFVSAVPPPGGGQVFKVQVSNSGGQGPRWSQNGHDLLYQQGAQMMAVGYTAKGDSFKSDRPRVWIAKLGGRAVDLGPDDRRAVVLSPAESSGTQSQEHEIVLLQNFTDELRRKVPVGK